MRQVVVSIVAAAVVAAGAAACGGSSESAATGGRLSGQVVFAGFGGKTDEAAARRFFAPFTKSTGVTVKLDEAAEDIVAKLRAANQAGNVPWSVIRIEEEDAVVLQQDGFIEPLPTDFKAKVARYFNPGAVSDYGVPYIDYSSILVCNSKLVSPCPTTFKEFWDTTRFKGRRTLYADGWLDNVVFALEADGVPKDQVFPPDVDRAFTKLDQIRNSIDVWWTNSDQAEQVFLSDEVALGAMWSGRASLLASEKEGIELYFDGALQARELWVVPKGAPNAAAALALIEWYASHPRAQAAFMVDRHNPLPNPQAYKYIPEDLAATLSTSPENAALSIPIDFAWVTKNRDEVYRRWQDWLTK
jgi:spermidine/putrescine-binding protein